jgi:hypothetical protein
MAWKGFGNREPGGSRTGSVVAVAMVSLSRAGVAKVFGAGLTVSVAGTSCMVLLQHPGNILPPRAM